MSLMESKGALSKATKDLFDKWSEIRETWSDAQSREFEKTYLFELDQDVRTAMGALDRMGSVLSKVRTDCE